MKTKTHMTPHMGSEFGPLIMQLAREYDRVMYRYWEEVESEKFVDAAFSDGVANGILIAVANMEGLFHDGEPDLVFTSKYLRDLFAKS